MTGRLVGRTAVVTGGAQGIGAATGLRLAREGAHVVLLDLNADAAAATAARIADDPAVQHGGGRASSAGCDVTDEHAVASAVANAHTIDGRLDILVNNAGITRDNLAMRMKDEEWDAVIRINLEAAFRLMRAACRPMMKAKFGRIITITSVVGATGNPGQMNYAAAKGGLTAMTKSLAQELASRNITVNCVAPGFIRTAMTEILPDAQKEALNGRIPMGRMGEGEDIGAAVAYLASREAGYVTGQTLHVNGGMAMFS